MAFFFQGFSEKRLKKVPAVGKRAEKTEKEERTLSHVCAGVRAERSGPQLHAVPTKGKLKKKPFSAGAAARAEGGGGSSVYRVNLITLLP